MNKLNRLGHLFLLITLWGGVLLLAGCGPDFEGGWSMPAKTETYEYEVGPEGGTIKVKDYSSLHGFKIVIPEGALADTTRITITRGANAPALPDGFDNGWHPDIKLSSDAPFLKEIQIYFPSLDTPENRGNMLCAFRWNTSKGSWQAVMPESFANDFMVVKTQHFSYWQWGEIRLDEAGSEALNSLLDEEFGPQFMERLADAFEVEALKLINGNNVDYCDNQLEIANALIEIKEDAKIRAEEYLQLVNATCSVWDHTPTIGDIFHGFEELVQIHLEYLGQTLGAEGLSLVPFIGGALTIMAKASAQALYEQRLSELKDQYICIFANAESELWINFGLYVSADAALLAMELAEVEYPCN